MDQSSGRCVLLTGAPLSEDLDWSEGRLLSTFTIGSKQVSAGTHQPASAPSWQPPKWRDIAMPAQKTHQKRRTQLQPPLTLSFANLVPSLPLATQHPDFLAHSIALLDDLVSSQIEPATGLGDDTTLGGQQTIASFASDWSDTSSFNDDNHLPQTVGPITDLKAIPTTSHIQAIVPQTKTVNLLAGVVTVSQPRTVSLRRDKDRTMEILELLLGDETSAGFSVSFWLVPLDESQDTGLGKKAAPEDLALRETLKGLRSGDVVALGNVALSCFRGVVYGQSMNRKVMRNSTWVAKISEEAKIEGELGGKVDRVREWAVQFVGGIVGRKTDYKTQKFGGVRNDEEELPPDTQTD